MKKDMKEMNEYFARYAGDLKKYLDAHWVGASGGEPGSAHGKSAAELTKGAEYTERDAKNLEELISLPRESFHDMLFRRIREKGLTDAEVYKRANLDRKLFYKIRSNPSYHSRKNTVLALAAALEMNAAEASQFLEKAGYAFSSCSKGDLIVRYFLEREVFDLQVINRALYEFGQPLLPADAADARPEE